MKAMNMMKEQGTGVSLKIAVGRCTQKVKLDLVIEVVWDVTWGRMLRTSMTFAILFESILRG